MLSHQVAQITWVSGDTQVWPSSHGNDDLPLHVVESVHVCLKERCVILCESGVVILHTSLCSVFLFGLVDVCFI